MSANLELPGPRIWKAQDIASFLRVSVSWVYKKTEAKSADPIPRIQGMGVIRCDTHSPAFREWIAKHLNPEIDKDSDHA
jgi:hypothetical protein